ncbi:Tetratricopeptide repeat-containing protein [Thermoactinomyces sp. DSM 45891]|uniref:helix-turn-helix domain-containing protein n=1 Tax=Thermoactinomyces sp. DSM 45891 TaxID=1761907 RepID=UPI000921CEB3|nr:helix-turn-helix domain-containing protein [Thermoactinomyces sp. DSM 45891]SFX35708.1 Tetratricopeptide repeat-containing protein [Thermoactinomyces sp. DSM 45891]
MGEDAMAALGKVFARKRKKLDLNQADIADETISAGMISHIENGKLKTISPKVMYLADKMGVDLSKIEDEISALIKPNGQIADIVVHHQLLRCEFLVNQQDIESHCIKNILNMIELDKENQHYPYFLLLNGKVYRKKGGISKAISYFERCISLCPDDDFLNIKATAYGDLAVCHYLNSDIKQAVVTVRKGIDSFVGQGERSYLFFNLQVDEIIYLEKLGLTNKILPKIEAMLKHKKEIDIESRLNLFEIYGRILLGNSPKEAINVLSEGLNLSLKNGSPERIVDLSIQLGQAYKLIGSRELAENYYQLALDLEDTLTTYKSVISGAYIELGKLHVQDGNTEAAEKLYLKALKIGKKHNDKIRVFDAHLTLGSLKLSQNDISAATSYFESGLEAAIFLKMDNLVEKVIVPLMECMRILGHDARVLDLVGILAQVKNREELLNEEVWC